MLMGSSSTSLNGWTAHTIGRENNNALLLSLAKSVNYDISMLGNFGEFPFFAILETNFFYQSKKQFYAKSWFLTLFHISHERLDRISEKMHRTNFMMCTIINVSNFHLRKGYRSESRVYVIYCSTFKFQTILDISEEKTMVLKSERMN